MPRDAVRHDAGPPIPRPEPREPSRRDALRIAGSAGLVTSFVLPTAGAAASTVFDLTQYSSYTVGFAPSATGSDSNSAYGFRLEPDQSAPDGVGAIPASGAVRLVQIDVLFVGGAGSKAVTGTAVDLAVYPSTAKRSGDAVVDQAVGNVVSTWGGATVLGASGTNTWLRFPFTAGTVLLDVGTPWYVGAIGPDGAFRDPTSVRTSPQSSGAWSTAVDSSGTAFTYRVVFTGTFAY